MPAKRFPSVLFAGLILAGLAVSAQSKLIDGDLPTKLVPKSVEYSVLLPDGYEAAGEPLPLVLFLHGGGGNRSYLTQMRPVIDDLWKSSALPKMVFATPSVSRSFYVDHQDGSEKWETFVLTEFLAHLRKQYQVSAGRRGTFVMGISMGGMGALRMAFKRPDLFHAVAALEPGIDPALRWKDVQPRNRFWRAPDLMERVFGKPFDSDYWEANNPASIAAGEASRLRDSGLAIYLECGDLDSFNLHEATEFLHRVLWDRKVLHEYRSVRAADHVGRTIGPRHRDALQFLSRQLAPETPDPAVTALKRTLEQLKTQYEKATGEKVR